MSESTQDQFEFDTTLGGFGLFEGFMPQETDEDGLPWEQADVLFPDATPRNQYEPLDPQKMPHVDAVKQDTPEYAARPAEERTRELFAYMRPHRMSLLGILAAAETPASTAHMEEVAERLRERKFSVYSASNLCTMLEAAGALERVVEDGTPYSSYTPTPDIEVIDGEEYWKPSEAPQVYWMTTPAGQLMIDENDPASRLKAVFAHEEEMLGIYKQVLELTRHGASIATLSQEVDANPLIADPRRFFVQHFVESLERCEALMWSDGQWCITPIGIDALEKDLADVECAQPSQPTGKSIAADGATVPTETQGVNW